jgi:hypothetical protein
MLTGCKTVLRDCTAQPKALAYAGQLPEGLVFAEREVATNSARILQLRASAHIKKIKYTVVYITSYKKFVETAAGNMLFGIHCMATKNV